MIFSSHCCVFALIVGNLTLASAGLVHAQSALRSADVTPAVSGAHLRSLAGAMHQTAGIGAEKRARPVRVVPLLDGPGTVRDTALQSSPGSAAPVTPGLGFDGIGAGRGSYVPRYAPPDTTGPVGATQYVQWVHADIAAFGKATGALAPGFPKASNALFAGLGGPCETSNDGDPMVQYDKAANCWILSQFAVPGGTAGCWQCLAGPATADATGAHYRDAFPYIQFNDCPTVGVWTDG